MKRIMVVASVMIMAALLTCISFSQVKAQCAPTIVLLNPPEKDPVELAVGESYTFRVSIESDEPFILAMAIADAYYPGRYIDWHGNDRATHATNAELQLTMTGRSPTLDLPDGVVPASISAGVRCKGSVVYSERIDFTVQVVEP